MPSFPLTRTKGSLLDTTTMRLVTYRVRVMELKLTWPAMLSSSSSSALE